MTRPVDRAAVAALAEHLARDRECAAPDCSRSWRELVAPARGRGRPRRYCSSACRQLAYRARLEALDVDAGRRPPIVPARRPAS